MKENGLNDFSRDGFGQYFFEYGNRFRSVLYYMGEKLINNLSFI